MKRDQKKKDGGKRKEGGEEGTRLEGGPVKWGGKKIKNQ